MIGSLKESCLRILTAHSGSLLDVGNCPYKLIRPVLFACTPDQLAFIEDQSPHLMLDSDEIWALHLSRDYPNQRQSHLQNTEKKLKNNSQPSSSSNLNGSSRQSTWMLTDSHEADNDDQLIPIQVNQPQNRIKYFEIRLEKERALVSASARLRQRIQESRSDEGKRKAIFTDQTDFGLGSQKKKKFWASIPSSRKTLADKARLQVKKSAAVYANGARCKPTVGQLNNNRSSQFSRVGAIATAHPSKRPIEQSPSSLNPQPSSSKLSPTKSYSTVESNPTTCFRAIPRSGVTVVRVVKRVLSKGESESESLIRPTPFPNQIQRTRSNERTKLSSTIDLTTNNDGSSSSSNNKIINNKAPSKDLTNQSCSNDDRSTKDLIISPTAELLKSHRLEAVNGKNDWNKRHDGAGLLVRKKNSLFIPKSKKPFMSQPQKQQRSIS
ncbi:RNA polymerase II transcription factor SIII subunit A-domain-containing protein [Phakopsora pachyrhizi]|nr:RNA polymerase II transcription factor SIII subunit A-domain-containing protein [Phakopsora pachyrhizi]